MVQEPIYDYIILGAGLSGLTLAVKIIEDPFFKDKKILMLDKRDKTQNDRTWCYWQQGEDPYEQIVSKKWNKILFKSRDLKKQINLAPYAYKKIEASDYYDFCLNILKEDSRVTFKIDTFQKFEETARYVRVYAEKQTYMGKKLFSSILSPQVLKEQRRYQVLNQHFIGWFIKTEQAIFDPETATFMDFSIPQRSNTRFMYLLPTSPNEALLEYTLFSENILPDQVYEKGIKSYLKRLKIDQYSIINKEKGVIPMTVYPFEKHNSRHVMHIGTAGGWTRASTGFTFTYTQKRTARLITFLKKNDDFRRFKLNDRYRWYDRLLLDVLYRKNKQGSILFETIFRKNRIDRIFKFLDGASSLFDDFKLISSLPKKEFIKALFSSNKPH